MAFEALKERQRIAWSSAPYEQVSEQHQSAIEALLDRLKLRPGRRLLDVATGTGELRGPPPRAAWRSPASTSLKG